MYYTYKHSKPCGEVFYVGKGTNERYLFKSNRSLFWKRIVEKHGFIAEIVETFESESDAYDAEIKLIAYYKSIGQCSANFTQGGDGVRVEKRWWNDKISKAMMGKNTNKGVDSALYNDFCCRDDLINHYENDGLSTIEIAKIYGVSYGTVWSRLKEFDIPIRKVGSHRKAILCVTDGRYFESVKDAAQYYGLFCANIRKVISGKYRHTGGKTFKYITGDSK